VCVVKTVWRATSHGVVERQAVFFHHCQIGSSVANAHARFVQVVHARRNAQAQGANPPTPSTNS
jgi:hypothetical protein